MFLLLLDHVFETGHHSILVWKDEVVTISVPFDDTIPCGCQLGAGVCETPLYVTFRQVDGMVTITVKSKSPCTVHGQDVAVACIR